MRNAPRALLAGGLGFAVSLLVACGGGGGLLSADEASNLKSQLDQVSAALGARQCGAAASAVSLFDNLVANLPGTVSPTLTNNLKQGAATVAQLTNTDCRSQATTTTPTTSTATTNTTATNTTTTQSTASNTNTAPPATSTTPATTPAGSGTTSTGGGTGGAGLGGGNGNGGGNGGAATGNGNGQ